MNRPFRTLGLLEAACAAALIVLAGGCRTTRTAAKNTGEVKPTGMLNVTADPGDATITVDGQPAGAGRQGPYKAGPHTVKAAADGFAPQEQAVTVTDNTDTPVTFALKKLPGTIQVKVNVDADCDIAGDHKKATPTAPASFEEPAGLIQIICRAPGYREASTLVGVKGGKTVVQLVNLASSVRMEPQTGLEFVWLPGGKAHIGCATGDTDCTPKDGQQAAEAPGKNVQVPSFWMGKTEVTVAAYAQCVAAHACATPKRTKGASCNWKEAGREKYPINCITQEEASEFCDWVGGRLPSLEEWEYAARSGRDQIYPWGAAPLSSSRANYCDKACRNHGRKEKGEQPAAVAAVDSDGPVVIPPENQNDGYVTTAPVGTFPDGATQEGLLDMSGNVAEWTGTTMEVHVEGASKPGQGVAIMGGAWNGAPIEQRVSAVHQADPKFHGDTVGVRCVMK